MYSKRQLFETMRLLDVFYREGVMHERSVQKIVQKLIDSTEGAYQEYWQQKYNSLQEGSSLFQDETEENIERRLFIWGTIVALKEAEAEGTLFDGRLASSWQALDREIPGLWEEGESGKLALK